MSENKLPDATLCWILKDGKALLKFASRGISKGKWNAVGGKVDSGETPLKCIRREAFEETGLRIRRPSYHGKFKFFFDSAGSGQYGIVHVFSADRFSGRLKENDEGELRWFDLDEIPFDKMWEGDNLWVPLMLSGRRFDGELYFNEDGSKLLKHKLEVKD